MDKKSAILALEDGRVFSGRAIGCLGVCVGEVIFNTSMTGYQEILTDPSYKGQIIALTHPHIGNVGVNQADQESSKIWASGFVVNQLSPVTSNWRAETSLEGYLKQEGIVGIAEIDTRYLTTLIREEGALGACICSDGSLDREGAISRARQAPSLEGVDLTHHVSTDRAYTWSEGTSEWLGKKRIPLPEPKHHVVVYDFGVKRNILRLLVDQGCKVTVVPARTSLDALAAYQPDGIVLSNGPGDPAACNDLIAQTVALMERWPSMPILGICLGHQLLALACGATTIKMKFGHHGANHPIQHVVRKRVYITTQNHGFAVDEKSLPPEWELTHRSLFDGSLQGMRHRSRPYISFQGHPEGSAGPQDMLSVWREFKQLMVNRERV